MNTDIKRRKSVSVKVGNVTIGGNSPILIQSMTNTDTHDIDATYSQVQRLVENGCDMVRLAVPDIEAARTFSVLKQRGINIPLVADVHFDYKIAIGAIMAGADKIRINPGNIGSRQNTLEVVKKCNEYGVPIRIGVNSGSLEKSLLQKYGSPNAKALAQSALNHAKILEELDFYNTVLSVKSSSVRTMIEANRILADMTEYPLHLGVTEAGAGARACIKSSIGIGSLLSMGIGDTVRVSLTEAPENEVETARAILSSLELCNNGGMDIISCPTCGRTSIDLIPLLSEFEAKAKALGLDKRNITVAFMGCAVNGPGEAMQADIGIAGGKGEALLFKKGEIIRKIKEESLVDELINEIKTAL